MGLRDFFEIKSFRQKEEEQRIYNQWAFPYGQEQKQRLERLLLELMPDEKTTGIAVFLIGKEAYGRDRSLDDACRALESQLPGKHRRKLYTFLALILADEQVDEGLCYPDAQALRSHAKQLEETR